MSVCDLDGLGVLVTRPRDQATVLEQAIRRLGGTPTLFPGVDVEPIEPPLATSALADLGRVDLVVFVSPTAVRFGVASMRKVLGSLSDIRVAAVGDTTAAELKKCGFENVITPGKSSGGEALVKSPELGDLVDQQVLIVRGEGGSDVLEAHLKSGGARVSRLECYRRRLPETPFANVAPLLRSKRIGAWMATSGEILDNLFLLAGEHADLLRDTPLFVNHPHVATRGFAQAVRAVVVTAGGDNGLINGLVTWFCRFRPTGQIETEMS